MTLRPFLEGELRNAYRHYPRSARTAFEDRLAAQLRENTGAHSVRVFVNAHVAFLVAAQPAHATAREAAARASEERWSCKITHRDIHMSRPAPSEG